MTNPNQPRDDRGRFTSRGGGWAAGAVALALVLGSGTGIGAGAAGSTGSSSTAGATRGGSNVSARGRARDRTTARVTQRLAREGLRVRERDIDVASDGDDCAAHSYGEVQEFFCDYPCSALFRAMFEVRDAHGNTALVAVAWVDMPDSGQARQLRRLMDRHGTGNVAEISREKGGQNFTGRHYRSTRDGATVINVQAEAVGRSRGAIDLARRATVAL